MKTILITLNFLGLMLFNIATAQAVTCAKGVYRAGCAGANGAVVKRTPPVTTVVATPRAAVIMPPPASTRVVTTHNVNCAWINGRKVCQ